MLLDGKSALVTGASRGIGRAIALRLAKEGAKVAVNYAGNETAANEVKAEIEKLGGEVILIKANVADGAACEAMVEEVVKAFGQIDILVNNAGITRDGLLIRMKEEDYDAVLSTNLKSVFHLTKAAGKRMMKKRYGRIINMTSVVGLMGNVGQTNYAAAKAGILGFSKSAAKEFASRGITVNMVAPGFIQTDMTAVLPDDVKEKLSTEIPLGRMGAPEDVAEAVLFLASDQAAYITGQVIHVDGGMVM
ncbi:3-oxoacyl-[acyl-carrier-protein] reductase [Selenomonas sp. TAMA-11512]|uniref:3-oxoacyl-[acyl-carrier-protein] reductase n=1 Tax=Selenomonas sp. TAMA-11512 TaxID=3095337 RepID=UPI003088FAA8|nr:3-oxoacyl-[acyl-carrier-protein] reductase [Selenomonas sp. TAMA-11512]